MSGVFAIDNPSPIELLKEAFTDCRTGCSEPPFDYLTIELPLSPIDIVDGKSRVSLAARDSIENFFPADFPVDAVRRIKPQYGSNLPGSGEHWLGSPFRQPEHSLKLLELQERQGMTVSVPVSDLPHSWTLPVQEDENRAVFMAKTED